MLPAGPGGGTDGDGDGPDLTDTHQYSLLGSIATAPVSPMRLCEQRVLHQILG